MQHITLFDYILLPLYIALFYWRVKKTANAYSSADLKKFMVTAFALRMFGTIAYSMVVQYYYGYGDSFTYYDGGDFFTQQINKDSSSISYLFSSFTDSLDWYNSSSVEAGSSGFFATPENNMVMRISAVLSYLSFNKFLIISLFFGFFSFWGQWKLFLVFDDINKQRNRKLLAYAILYSPSLWFWGSGLLKDSICLGAIGFIIHILYKFFAKRKFSLFDLLSLVFFIFLITMVKPYITNIVCVGIVVMLFSLFLKTIKNKILRLFFLLISIMMTGVLLYASNFAEQINEMTEESVMQIQQFQHNYQSVNDSEETSKAGYGLGELGSSVGSLILKSPLVIFTCLFRPFLWESGKAIILFTSLESLMVFISTLFVMVKMGIISFFRAIFTTPHLLFCFTISMLFALIIGFTTFNFGTMVRYKIIFLPFYYFLLVNLYTNYIASKKQTAAAALP
jgi:hypothetical protein